MNKQLPSLSRCASICAVLMLALLICQFLPFWNTGTDTVSISSFIWFPTDNTAVTELLQPHTDAQYPINDIVTPCVLMLLLSAATLVFWVFSRENVLLPICSLVAGIAGIWVCATRATFRLGGLWWLILIISILAAAASLLMLMLQYRQRRSDQE